MKLARQGKISYLQPAWAQQGEVEAGFTTRNGGVSRPPYNSLNLGFNTEDPRNNVEGNRSTVARAFGLPPHLLLTVRQVHGTDVLVIDEPNPDLSHFLTVECDAIVTNQPGIMIGMLVADCFPVLLLDPVKKVVAAVHVGWRGAAAGILGKTHPGPPKRLRKPPAGPAGGGGARHRRPPLRGGPPGARRLPPGLGPLGGGSLGGSPGQMAPRPAPQLPAAVRRSGARPGPRDCDRGGHLLPPGALLLPPPGQRA